MLIYFSMGTNTFPQKFLGTSICTFKALGADSVTINPSGPLSPYNDLQSQDNGDGSLNISLFAKTSYSNYVDGVKRL